MTFEVELLDGSSASPEDVEQFKLLVRKGGEVGTSTLGILVSDALALAVVRVDGALVAVGALKRPNRNYRKRVFSKAGVGNPDEFPYELGWVYVEQEYRGRRIASRIVESLLSHLGGAAAYATSLVDNGPMHRCLAVHGFVGAGSPYASSRPGQSLLLFLKR